MSVCNKQLSFLEDIPDYSKTYKPLLTASVNGKGVMDVDTVKGCEIGMKVRPGTGCYGECYANKSSLRYGRDFSISVSRILNSINFADVFSTIKNHYAEWYRIGVAGDPCHDWENTISICEQLKSTGKVPVIITKHWRVLSDEQIERLKNCNAVINTSTSGLDTDQEMKHRVKQIQRLKDACIVSVNRVVTCNFGTSDWALKAKEKQDYLLTILPVIDNPLRASSTNERVISGDIILTKREDSVGGGKFVSLHNADVYLGSCKECPDQCGVDVSLIKLENKMVTTTVHADQTALFEDKIEWVYVESVLGSGYENDVAVMAIEDGIAKRAARKNMQIHSAVILKINDEFSGFFTFQNNHEEKEFCFLQSVIAPEKMDKKLYAQMVLEVLHHNEQGYPAIITTDPKSKFETPALFESIGFITYLKMSGFHYMVKGSLESVRMKLLAHVTMTNVWNTVKGDWLRLKKEWKEQIEEAGLAAGVENPMFASREGCWQGENGYANVVNSKKSVNELGDIVTTTKSHNGNASVLDPLACEVIARFFMPAAGKRIYNPFGGGVQMGFVAGGCGFEYVASEIRQNQVDANNKICSQFSNVKWVKSDSSTYEPEGMFDLIFSCPPYYKVEKYVDYDGNPPEGEINASGTYEEFRDLLFSGYKKAIASLKDNCFFVVMTGDSRDKKGGYHCHESETEIFFKEQGLSIYNKIVYVECEFTRLAHAKKTLHTRKFPKREQKIIVAYKGDIQEIKNNFAKIGRL